MAYVDAQFLLKASALLVAIPTSIYLGILALLIASTSVQTNVFYLHRIKLTSFDLAKPEMFGFMPRQVDSFSINTADGETLHAWHVLPLACYRRAQKDLLYRARSHLDLLREDPHARLVIYLHGTSGTIGSGFRPASYRALSAMSPEHLHVLSIEYRGYGLSSGVPSEAGLLQDAIAAVQWAVEEARLPASRIVIFGQSLGTAVGISLGAHFASSVDFAGLVLVAAFTDVATLTGTYRIGGVVPVLSPLTRIPRLFAYFTGFLQSTWLSKDRIVQLVSSVEARKGRYHITMIHAEDDPDIPFSHTDQLFRLAVSASTSAKTIDSQDWEHHKESTKTDLAGGGYAAKWQSAHGDITEILTKYGSHDRLMSYPVASLAVFEAFRAADQTLGS